MMEQNRPDREQILDMATGFQRVCVLGAAAELDLFTVLGSETLTADGLAERLGADRRATPMLLDALAGLGFLDKQDDRYSVPADLRPSLIEDSPESLLPILRLWMNVLRGWSQLAWVTKAGIPGPRQSSIRGPEADRAAFIAAMHVFSGKDADDVVARLGPPKFEHFLDIGGASGTWTLAFLRTAPAARATIFDLPDAIRQAEGRIAGTDFADRIHLVPGDFYGDDLPGGADFAWLGAIVHQHSRQHNRELFAKVHAALRPGGRIAVRDVVMTPSRTGPPFGVLFAINMLVNTDSGGTFTFDELAEDLQAAGFTDPVLAVKDEAMNSVVLATKPQ